MGELFSNPLHLWVLLIVVMLIFGAGKLPEAAAGLGKSVREFRKEIAKPEDDDKPQESAPVAQAVLPQASATCNHCGQAVPAGARFCQSCGNAIDVTPRCPACLKETTPGASFCMNCGQSLVSGAVKNS